MVTAPAAETPLTNASRDRDGGLRALLGKKPLMVIINERSRWSFRLAGCGPILTSSVQTV
jgi:hypothetical protein